MWYLSRWKKGWDLEFFKAIQAAIKDLGEFKVPILYDCVFFMLYARLEVREEAFAAGKATVNDKSLTTKAKALRNTLRETFPALVGIGDIALPSAMVSRAVMLVKKR